MSHCVEFHLGISAAEQEYTCSESCLYQDFEVRMNRLDNTVVVRENLDRLTRAASVDTLAGIEAGIAAWEALEASFAGDHNSEETWVGSVAWSLVGGQVSSNREDIEMWVDDSSIRVAPVEFALACNHKRKVM